MLPSSGLRRSACAVLLATTTILSVSSCNWGAAKNIKPKVVVPGTGAVVSGGGGAACSNSSSC